MVTTMNEFIRLVNDGKSGIVIDIVRIKNGFKHIPKWQNLNDYGYCDIKFNVIIRDPVCSEYSMIGEIQWLLEWLNKAKKIGHKLYVLFCFVSFCFACARIKRMHGLFGVLFCFVFVF